MKKWKRVRLALKLYTIGKRLERAREKLKRLYLDNEPNDSRKMVRARKRFNRLCERWNKQENTFFAYRDENTDGGSQ